MSDIREWLVAQCADGRPGLTEPMTVTLSDGPWTVATNGYRLAAVPGDLGFPVAAGDSPARIRQVMEEPLISAPRRFSLSAMRAFVGPSVETGHCGTCKGTRVIECPDCDGEGLVECSCLECDHVHDRECDECDGAGTVACMSCVRPAPKLVRIGGALFNGHNASPLFAGAPGETATWQQDKPESPAYIAGEGWRGILMPTREDSRGEQAPSFEFDATVEVTQ